jgi:hypothetical protein
MSRDDDDERGRAEPIDVDYEPYREGGHGIGAGTAIVLAVIAAGVGAAGGAVAPRVAPVRTALDSAFPISSAAAPAPTATSLAAIDRRLDAIEGLINTPLTVATTENGGDAGTVSRVIALQGGLRDVRHACNKCRRHKRSPR